MSNRQRNIELRERFITKLSRFLLIRKCCEADSPELRAIIVFHYSSEMKYHSPYVIANMLKLDIIEVRKFFYNWTKYNVFTKDFVPVNKNNIYELAIIGMCATANITCQVSVITSEIVNLKPEFIPLTIWPASIPFPVIKPYVQPDGKSYSGRQRYNELVDYCYRRRHYPVKDRLQQLLPLYDDVASKAEQKDYIRLTNKVFPSVRRSNLIAQEHELRRVG